MVIPIVKIRQVSQPSHLYNGNPYTQERLYTETGPCGMFQKCLWVHMRNSTTCEVLLFTIWVKYFVRTFKGNIWNSTQSVLPICWKIYISYGGETFRVLKYETFQIDGLVQERRNSIANALELHLSCIDALQWPLDLILSTVKLTPIWGGRVPGCLVRVWPSWMCCLLSQRPVSVVKLTCVVHLWFICPSAAASVDTTTTKMPACLWKSNIHCHVFFSTNHCCHYVFVKICKY